MTGTNTFSTSSLTPEEEQITAAAAKIREEDVAAKA
jgi:hypothetical protein